MGDTPETPPTADDDEDGDTRGLITDESNAGGQPHQQHDDVYPVVAVDREESDDDISSQPPNEGSVGTADGETNHADPTEIPPRYNGAAAQARRHQPLEADVLARPADQENDEEDYDEGADNARRRYHLRPRAPVGYRDARAYRPRRRRN